MTAKKYGGNDDLDNLVTLCEVCHKFAPEGGTQGIKGSIDRSRLPRELCEDICKAVEHSILI
jgi:5-methylcytosine-specific restriction endonuclease McrA